MYKACQSQILIITTLLFSAPLLAQSNSDDPMRPPVETAIKGMVKKSAKSTRAATYRLSSIRIARNQRSAMINGKMLTTGERIGDAILTDIQANHVTLRVAGKKVTLSLLPLRIKKPVEANQK